MKDVYCICYNRDPFLCHLLFSFLGNFGEVSDEEEQREWVILSPVNYFI